MISHTHASPLIRVPRVPRNLDDVFRRRPVGDNFDEAYRFATDYVRYADEFAEAGQPVISGSAAARYLADIRKALSQSKYRDGEFGRVITNSEEVAALIVEVNRRYASSTHRIRAGVREVEPDIAPAQPLPSI